MRLGMKDYWKALGLGDPDSDNVMSAARRLEAGRRRALKVRAFGRSTLLKHERGAARGGVLRSGKADFVVTDCLGW